MNELRITGRVLNAYVNESGHFTCVIACMHDHYVNGFNTTSESVFRAFLPDVERSKHIDIIKGDEVLLTGYIRLDNRVSATGVRHQRLNVYIRDIELVKPKPEFGLEFRR